MLRRSLAGIAALLMGVSFIFTLSASAHDINLGRVRLRAREYAEATVREDSRYTSSKTACTKLNTHLVRCVIQYYGRSVILQKNPSPLCTETIDGYYLSHDRDNSLYLRHVTQQCGSRRLDGPNP